MDTKGFFKKDGKNLFAGSDVDQTTAGESENEQAVKIIKDIDDRLQGKIGGLPLSVKGQVHQQIEQAVSLENLSEVWALQM